jgi:DNA polymerase-4
VVATANYVARRYGVHSAMPLRTARRLCPHGVYLPGHHKLYAEYSKRLMAMLDEYSPLVEQISLDEAFVDLTGTEKLFGSPVRTARLMQKRVRRAEAEHLVVPPTSCWPKSLRILRNRPIHRGTSGEEADFLAPLPVGGCPGWASLLPAATGPGW